MLLRAPTTRQSIGPEEVTRALQKWYRRTKDTRSYVQTWQKPSHNFAENQKASISFSCLASVHNLQSEKLSKVESFFFCENLTSQIGLHCTTPWGWVTPSKAKSPVMINELSSFSNLRNQPFWSAYPQDKSGWVPPCRSSYSIEFLPISKVSILPFLASHEKREGAWIGRR